MGYIRSNKCPKCGGTNLILDSLYQYGIVQKINKNGKVSKRGKKVDYGSIDCAYISCQDCGWTSPDAENGTDKDGYLLMWKDWYNDDE